MLRDGYTPIVDALGLGQSQNPAAFFDNSQAHEPVLMRSDLAARQGGFMASMIDRPRQEELLAGEIRARRAKDQISLPDCRHGRRPAPIFPRAGSEEAPGGERDDRARPGRVEPALPGSPAAASKHSTIRSTS
jgi:hypothetical protein